MFCVCFPLNLTNYSHKMKVQFQNNNVNKVKKYLDILYVLKQHNMKFIKKQYNLKKKNSTLY